MLNRNPPLKCTSEKKKKMLMMQRDVRMMCAVFFKSQKNHHARQVHVAADLNGKEAGLTVKAATA